MSVLLPNTIRLAPKQQRMKRVLSAGKGFVPGRGLKMPRGLSDLRYLIP
jgi:hypothetical protein